MLGVYLRHWASIGRYEASQGYTNREVAAAVIWADCEGYTWSQLRVRNAKVLYRSVKRMGPDTAPARKLQKVGHSNVLVDCFMKVLKGRIPENTAGSRGEGRQLAVNKALQWNTGRETQMVKWKDSGKRWNLGAWGMRTCSGGGNLSLT